MRTAIIFVFTSFYFHCPFRHHVTGALIVGLLRYPQVESDLSFSTEPICQELIIRAAKWREGASNYRTC